MPQNKKNIVLIGMMGAGKSTIAQKLSEILKSYPLVDLDEEIEKSAGIPITEIFEKHSESYFRDLETQCTKNICQNSGQIISTGGGIVVRNENIEHLKKNGVLFYLKASAKMLYERVKNESHRPLLQKENPLKIIEELLKIREPLYKTADFEVETQNKNFEEITKEIIEKYETRI